MKIVVLAAENTALLSLSVLTGGVRPTNDEEIAPVLEPKVKIAVPPVPSVAASRSSFGENLMVCTTAVALVTRDAVSIYVSRPVLEVIW